MVRNNFAGASGRPAAAYAFPRIAEPPTTTFEDLQDSGHFESIDCKLSAGLTAVLNAELQCRSKKLTAQERNAGRMLK
eukprot:1405875-Pyramimonas_sp.AAC.1